MSGVKYTRAHRTRAREPERAVPSRCAGIARRLWLILNIRRVIQFTVVQLPVAVSAIGNSQNRSSATFPARKDHPRPSIINDTYS